MRLGRRRSLDTYFLGRALFPHASFSDTFIPRCERVVGNSREENDVGQIFAREPRVEIVEEAVEIYFSVDEALEKSPERPVDEIVVDAEVARVMKQRRAAILGIPRDVDVP